MTNEMQTEVQEITLDELRKVNWNYAENTIVGCHQNIILKIFLFEIANPGCIHPLLIQGCNVAEGWIECLIVEPYPKEYDSFTPAEFFTKVQFKRDENGDILREKLYQEVVVNLLDVCGRVVFTISRK